MQPAAPPWVPRLAAAGDIGAIEELIPVSVRALHAPHHTAAQIEAALGPVFGVDRQLIRDGTYFVVEAEGRVVGCGGWSRRAALCGSDQGRGPDEPLLDPRADPARIRAFFVHPGWARRGIARSLLVACEGAIAGAGFRAVVIAATLAGEPLYAAFGYGVEERYEVGLDGGLRLPVVRMAKTLGGPVQPP
jgi:GNAT superfamily N-acetyltransferase